MKPEKVIIQNNKKEKIVGRFYKGSSKTIIIVCHGIESANNFSDITVRQILQEYFSEISFQTGASVFSFDFSGYGESAGEYFLSFKQRDHDIKAVLDYFSTHHKKIILYGHSMAGISVAIASLKYKEVAGLITINGFFTLHPTTLFRFNLLMMLSYLFSNPRFGLEMYYWIKNLKIKKISVPTLVVYSDKDSLVNPKQSMNFYHKLHTKKKVVIFQSDDHAILKENLTLPIAIAKWLKQEVEK